MTLTAPQTRIDPLHAFMARQSGATAPMPLVATRLDVIIDAGLAIVTTTRIFRNHEPTSIEATLTFPVPVHATLFALQARIGARVLDARARRKQARAPTTSRRSIAARPRCCTRRCCAACTCSRSATSRPAPRWRWSSAGPWRRPTSTDAATCAFRSRSATSMGRPACIESDDLIHARADQVASLAVQCRDGTVTLRGGVLENGRAQVPLDAPIDLEVAGWTPRELRGRCADGRAVALRIEPAAGGESALDVALVIDRSGSMAELCTSTLVLSKHAAMLLALDDLAKRPRSGNTLDLWEFSDACHHVGAIEAQSAAPSLRFAAPDGGTEIGAALETVIAGSAAPDLLLLTDGKSHALDVQSLARSGRRIAVVLIGEDSLEANVGHLAALTGGEIFIAAGHDIAPALAAALRALRSKCRPTVHGAVPAGSLIAGRAGMRLIANVGPAGTATEDGIEARAVAALAASLRLPTLATAEAAALAEAEGLVTHLTSLVLVDESGATQESVPASRKVPLATPATQAVAARLSRSLASFHDGVADELRLSNDDRARATGRPRAASRRMVIAPGAGHPGLRKLSRRLAGLFGHAMLERSGEDLSRIARNLNWDFAPDRLQAGDLTGLGSSVQEAIRKAAARSDVIALARRLGLDPIVLVIGLMAHAVAQRNRSARRLARAILPDTASEELKNVARGLGVG